MIIETSDNRFYRVQETKTAGLDHCWYGKRVKRVRGQWIETAEASRTRLPELVRKAATRIVEQ